MSQYDERLEALLLEKDYADLTAAERKLVTAHLGGAAAYAAAREMRKRSQALLQAEKAPADPDGLAIVMARTRRPAATVPLWQAAAAAVLIAVAAWWGRGLTLSRPVKATEVMAAVDTVLREVRLVDTVYLPAPSVAAHPLTQEVPAPDAPAPRPGKARKGKRTSPSLPRKLAAAIATLPDPGQAGRSGALQMAVGLHAEGGAPESDKFSMEN